MIHTKLGERPSTSSPNLFFYKKLLRLILVEIGLIWFTINAEVRVRQGGVRQGQEGRSQARSGRKGDVWLKQRWLYIH